MRKALSTGKFRESAIDAAIKTVEKYRQSKGASPTEEATAILTEKKGVLGGWFGSKDEIEIHREANRKAILEKMTSFLPPYLANLAPLLKLNNYPRKYTTPNLLCTLSHVLTPSSVNNAKLLELSTCIECITLGSYLFAHVEKKEELLKSVPMSSLFASKVSEKYVILAADFFYATAFGVMKHLKSLQDLSPSPSTPKTTPPTPSSLSAIISPLSVQVPILWQILQGTENIPPVLESTLLNVGIVKECRHLARGETSLPPPADVEGALKIGNMAFEEIKANAVGCTQSNKLLEYIGRNKGTWC